MATATKPLTAAEFAALPDEPDSVMELVRGEIVRMPKPKPRHGRIANRIAFLLTAHVTAHGAGEVYAAETGFLIARDPDTVRGADAAYLSNGRLALVTDPDDYYPVAPDLVAEVTSPDDRPGAVADKIAEWLSAGVRMLWQVYPAARTVVVHRPGAEPVTLGVGDRLDGGDVLPGFRCPVADLFA